MILGIDWLSLYHEIFDQFFDIITLSMPSKSSIVLQGSFSLEPMMTISYIWSRRPLSRCCDLTNIHDVNMDSPSLYSVPILYYFTNVFPTDLHSLLLSMVMILLLILSLELDLFPWHLVVWLLTILRC